jgi:hypothetical protein
VRAVEGGEVMVKPPASGMWGMWTSSHWPGRWWKGGYWAGKVLERCLSEARWA